MSQLKIVAVSIVFLLLPLMAGWALEIWIRITGSWEARGPGMVTYCACAARYHPAGKDRRLSSVGLSLGGTGVLLPIERRTAESLQKYFAVPCFISRNNSNPSTDLRSLSCLPVPNNVFVLQSRCN